MNKFIVKKSIQFEKDLNRVEDFILESTDGSFEILNSFVDKFEKTLELILKNPKVGKYYDKDSGERTWPFGNGRYRLFYKLKISRLRVTIFLTNLIDNRELNANIYPGNSFYNPQKSYNSD